MFPILLWSILDVFTHKNKPSENKNEKLYSALCAWPLSLCRLFICFYKTDVCVFVEAPQQRKLLFRYKTNQQQSFCLFQQTFWMHPRSLLNFPVPLLFIPCQAFSFISVKAQNAMTTITCLATCSRLLPPQSDMMKSKRTTWKPHNGLQCAMNPFEMSFFPHK